MSEELEIPYCKDINVQRRLSLEGGSAILPRHSLSDLGTSRGLVQPSSQTGLSGTFHIEQHSSEPSHRDKLSPFLNLPGELRNQIYRLLLTTEGAAGHNKIGFKIYKLVPSILCVNRQVNKEATGILYHENTFFVVKTNTLKLKNRLAELSFPAIATGSRAESPTIPWQALQITVNILPITDRTRLTLLVAIEDLPAFCIILWLCYSHDEPMLNYLTVEVHVPDSHPPRSIREQRQLLSPFLRLHSFHHFDITGSVNQTLVQDLYDSIIGIRSHDVNEMIEKISRLNKEVSTELAAVSYRCNLLKSQEALAMVYETVRQQRLKEDPSQPGAYINDGRYHGLGFGDVMKTLYIWAFLQYAFVHLKIRRYVNAYSLSGSLLNHAARGYKIPAYPKAELYYCRAFAMLRMGNLPTAKKELMDALRCLPNHTVSVKALVRVQSLLRINDGDQLGSLLYRVLDAGAGIASWCDRLIFRGN